MDEKFLMNLIMTATDIMQIPTVMNEYVLPADS